MPYIATVSLPGCLPEGSDEPDLFDTAREAWEFLRDEWQESEDQELTSRYAEDEDYEEPIKIEDFTSPSRKFEELIKADRADCMWLPRAGHDANDPWDLGHIWSVDMVEED